MKHQSIGSFCSMMAAVGLMLGGHTVVFAQEEVEADAGIEEVVVTARKTEENLQEIPVSVSVLSGEDLFERGLHNIEDISRQVAGFLFDSPFGRQFDRPIIRGQANILGASGVSVFVDGVNVPHSIRSFNFGDVERVEVIKGPQSALFGRNTYSGALNITTRQPSDEFDGDFSVELGQYGHQQLLANISGPMVEDSIYFNISGRLYDFDSQFDEADNENPSVGNESSRTISASIRASLTEDWDVTLRYSRNSDDDGHFPIGLLGYDKLNVNVPGGMYVYSGDPASAQPFYDGVVKAEDPNPSGSEQLSDTLGEGGGLERDDSYFSLNSTLGFDGGTLFATYGRNDESFQTELDSDGQPGEFLNGRIFGPFPLGPPGAPWGVGILPFDFTNNDDDETETSVFELRYDSPADQPTRWRLGTYLFQSEKLDRSLAGRFQGGENNPYYQTALASFNAAHREVAQALNLRFIIPLAGFSWEQSNPITSEVENRAVFAAVARDLSDTVTASLELRQAVEDITQSTNKIFCEPDPDDPDDDCGTTYVQEAEFKAFTPRLTLDYQRTPNQLLFGIFAQGTKPGGFNNEAAQELGFGSFEEEDANVLELGVKNTFSDGYGNFNLSLFRSDVDGYQLTQNLSALGATTTVGSATANIGKVQINGLELETIYTPKNNTNLTLGANYALTNAKFKEGGESTQRNVFGDDDLEGQKVPRQAPHQLVVFMNYDFSFAGGDSNGSVGFDGSYLASRYAQVQNLAETGSSFEMGARMVLRFGGTDNDRYTLSFWGKNLTDDDTPLGVLRFIDALGANSYTLAGNPLPSVFQLASAGQSRGFQYNNRNGRRFGVSLRLNF